MANLAALSDDSPENRAPLYGQGKDNPAVLRTLQVSAQALHQAVGSGHISMKPASITTARARMAIPASTQSV